MLYNTIDKATPVISDYKKDNKTGVNGVFLPHVLVMELRYITGLEMKYMLCII